MDGLLGGRVLIIVVVVVVAHITPSTPVASACNETNIPKSDSQLKKKKEKKMQLRDFGSGSRQFNILEPNSREHIVNRKVPQTR